MPIDSYFYSNIFYIQYLCRYNGAVAAFSQKYSVFGFSPAAVHIGSIPLCMSWVFLTIMTRFTDRVSHPFRSQEWPHSYCNHHRPNTIRAYQVTCLAKLGATKPFITTMRHVITMMTSEIIKFIFWVFTISKYSTVYFWFVFCYYCYLMRYVR